MLDIRVVTASLCLSLLANSVSLADAPPSVSRREPDAIARPRSTTTSEAPASDARGAVDQTPPLMANGIAFDSGGHLWIADGLGSELLQLQVPGTRILARHGRPSGVDGPDDLVVDDDYVYYTANWTLAGAVARLDRKTGQTRVIGRTGAGTNPIVRLPSGRLLAGVTVGTSPELSSLLGLTGLYEIDPTGAAPAKRVVRDSLGINAFCIGPDGFVYGPAGDRVVRIDLARGTNEVLKTGFGVGAAVRWNPRDGALYVLDAAPPKHPKRPLLYRMALDGSDGAVFAVLSEQPDALLGAADNFAIAPDGTFYVTRFAQPVISRVASDGGVLPDVAIGARSVE